MLNQHKKTSYVGGGFFRSYGVAAKITLRIRMKSHWRRIQKKESVRRKVHALEKIAYLDVPTPLFFAARLRAALQREKIVTLKKVSHVTGDFFSTPYGSRMILELSYDKKQGLWVVLLRDALTMRVIDSRCGKKRNPTLSYFFGCEVQFVFSSADRLRLRLLRVPPKIVLDVPKPQYNTGTSTGVPYDAHEPQPDEALAKCAIDFEKLRPYKKNRPIELPQKPPAALPIPVKHWHADPRYML